MKCMPTHTAFYRNGNLSIKCMWYGQAVVHVINSHLKHPHKFNLKLHICWFKQYIINTNFILFDVKFAWMRLVPVQIC